MRKKWLSTGIGVLALVAVLVAVSPDFTLVARSADVSVPPSVVLAGGDVISEYDPGEPLVLTFSQPMDEASTASALRVEPRVPFSLVWRDSRHAEVRFERLARERAYVVTVGAGAKSREGLDLGDPVTITLRTAADLAVSDVQPSDGAKSVPLNSNITVVFNHPVVELSGEADQSKLPHPLTFTPEVGGSGEWINTTIYRFTPRQGLVPLTKYTVVVDESLTDISGASQASAYTWSFTTVAPYVASYSPGESADGVDGAEYARPTDPIRINFAQPMDKESVEEGLQVRLDSATGADVAGRTRWSGNSLVFTPSQPWQRGAIISVQLAGAEAIGGSSLPTLAWTFQVVPRLRLVSSTPSNGAKSVAPGSSVRVLFSAPVDFESLQANVSVEPKPAYMYVYWDSERSAYIDFSQDAATEYTVTIGAALRDASGQRLGQDVSFSFTTGDWSPSFSLSSSWYPWAYGADDVPKAHVSYRNVSRLDFALYSLQEETFVRLNGDDWSYQSSFVPDDDWLVRAWSIEPDADRNQWGSVASPLDEDGGSLPTGIYYLVVTVPEKPSPEWWEMARQTILVIGQNVTMKWGQDQALAWVTTWGDGEPTSGVPVRVVDSSNEVLATGKTGTDGVFIDAVSVPKSWGTYFAFSGTAGDDDFGVTSTAWTEGINPWRYEVYLSGYSSEYALYLYTDRQIYRPGQTVYYKGIVRYESDARYEIPTDLGRLPVSVTDSQGQEVFSGQVTLNSMGTFNGSFTLAEGAPLGYYSIYVPVDTEAGYGLSAWFQVAEYRRPEYEISVVTDQSDYLQGDDVAVTAEASYYFGGGVSDASVRWAVLTEDYYFYWQGEGYYDFVDYDYWLDTRYYGSYGEAIAQGRGTTDSDGRFTFEFPADIAAKPVGQVYTIEVTVTDVNNQEVSARTTAVVHKGAFYVGVRPQTYVSAAGDEAGVDVITVDPQSQPVGGEEVSLTFYQHRWFNVLKKVDGVYEWTTTVEDEEVATETVTTNRSGEAAATFVPEEAGTYKVVAVAKDEFGNEIRSSTYMWVAGQGYVSWEMQEDETIELITDKKSYDVGDTAQVLIPSPYEGTVKALMTVERGRVLDYEVIDVESSAHVVEVPITKDHAPNVYFVAVLMRGEKEDTSLPAFQVGFAAVQVATATLQIDLEVKPDRTEPYEPGDEAVFTITALDSDGNPVDAEMSLNLVDKSVLALTGDSQQSLVDYFYGQRGLGVSTSLTMAISAEELEEAAMGKGGGGGGDGGEVRDEFPETAYWEPALRTGKDGAATVGIDLPDNLTTWRLQAKAVTADTLVAETYVEIVSTKDLLLTSVLPRFMVVGDEAMVGAVVHNNTATALTIDVDLAAEGLECEAETQRVNVAAGGRQKVTWLVTATEVGQASVTVRARAGDHADALKQSLPVYGMTVAEVVATSGQVDAGESVVEGVTAPDDIGDGELSVTVEASLAAGMIPGLSYLTHYPYECVEQTMSRFLPNVVTARALRELGLDDAGLTENLAEQVTVGLQRLYGNQHDDGGWGWWYADSSNPFLSAYVVYGLAQARDAGYSVDSGVLDRALSFLEDSLHKVVTARGGRVSVSDDVRAYIAYVLAEAGEGDLGATVSIYEKRSTLTNRSKAYLLMALSILSPEEESRLDALVADLKGAAVITATTAYWQDKAQWQTMGTDVVTTAVVIQALSRVAPDETLLPNAVRWIMAARQDGYWRSTYETATTIMGLTDYMVASGELEANYAWTIALNGDDVASGRYTAKNLTEGQSLVVAIADLLQDQTNTVTLSRGPIGSGPTDSGQMYYTMSLRYYPPTEELRAVNGGIIVTRDFRSVDNETQRVTSAAVNDMIQVKLTIIAPNDLYHVVVEDPFPAGCEGVDTSLVTTTVVGVEPEIVAEDAPWGWWWFSHTEMRDDKAVLFATYLPQGTYEYTYYIRASIPGEYGVRPAQAYQMYFPDVYGHSDGMHFVVTEAGK